MEINIEIRQKQLENLDQFIQSSKTSLYSILNEFGWTEKTVKDVKTMAVCSNNAQHRLPADRITQHSDKCKLKISGYDFGEEFLSEPLNDSKSKIYIDNRKKMEILSIAHSTIPDFRLGWNGHDTDPQTANRFLSTYSADERCILYDYTRNCTEGPPIPPEFNINEPLLETHELSYEQRLEAERNAKRRRIKYKTVHTSHKSHVEVLRDVITNQMDLYVDWLQETTEKTLNSDVQAPPQGDLSDRSDSTEVERSSRSRTSVHSDPQTPHHRCDGAKRRRSRELSASSMESRRSTRPTLRLDEDADSRRRYERTRDDYRRRKRY